MIALESSGSISDSHGSLLFYTDGKKVWSKNHSIMSNGNNLEGNESASQNGLILKHTDNDSLYYIFTTPFSNNYLDGLKYSVVNINRNNGLGEVVKKNIILHTNSSEKVSAVFHSNGKDIWIIGHEWGNNNFFSYLLKNDGIVMCPVINSIGFEYKKTIYMDGYFTNQGFIKFSPNYEFMAHVFTPNDPFNIFSEIYKIDRFNCKLELFSKIPFTVLPWSVEFSENSKNLLLGRRDSSVIIYNLKTDSIRFIDTLVFSWDSHMQLSPNGLIYFSNYDSTFVGSINCNNFDSVLIIKKAISLDSGRSNYGFPNIFVGFLNKDKPQIQYTYNCDSFSYKFKITNNDSLSHWYFTNNSSSFSSSFKEPLVTFNDTGLWKIFCILNNNDTLKTTIYKKTTILSETNKIGWCSKIDTAIILNAPPDMKCYEWNTGNNSPSISILDTGKYWVSYISNDYCKYQDTINVIIDTLVNIESDFLGMDIHWCENIDTSVLLEAPSGYNKYNWNTSDTLNEITITSKGIYSVSISINNLCNQIISDTINVYIDTLPNNGKGFLDQNIKWCENIDTFILLNAPTGHLSYIWNTGESTSSIKIDSKGKYYVNILMNNGCIYSDTTIVSLIDAPVKPIIFQSNDSLITNSSFPHFIWFRNQTKIAEGTNFIHLSENGTYQLLVQNESGCYNLSDTLHVGNLTLGTKQVKKDKIILFPNPAKESFNVEFLEYSPHTIQVIDLHGRVLLEEKIQSNQPNIQLSTQNLNNGIYFIKTISQIGNTVHKLEVGS